MTDIDGSIALAQVNNGCAVSDPHAEPGRGELSPINRRLIDASEDIQRLPPSNPSFLHSVLCQVGIPRRYTDARTFERRNGYASILLEAGKLFDGRGFLEQPLPYGAIPRLVLIHLSSEAVRTQQRSIEIGESMHELLTTLGIPTNGAGYNALRQQLLALAACRLTIGMVRDERVVTVDAKPIKRFEAWLQSDGAQNALWPGVLELSEEFFSTLTASAVPLDPRALAALKHSALALDVYLWLAQRLCRVPSSNGTQLSWRNLYDQFGQEYRCPKNFKHEFRRALRQVLSVYPGARVETIDGGIRLRPSNPPLAPTSVSLSRLSQYGTTVDNPGMGKLIHAQSPPPRAHNHHPARPELYA